MVNLAVTVAYPYLDHGAEACAFVGQVLVPLTGLNENSRLPGHISPCRAGDPTLSSDTDYISLGSIIDCKRQRMGLCMCAWGQLFTLTDYLLTFWFENNGLQSI